jgi:hypothetical protein
MRVAARIDEPGMREYQYLKLEQADAVLTLTLDRPERLNAPRRLRR